MKSAPAVKLTYDDFVNFPDDGKRHELIDGCHFVTPSPSTRHQVISARLLALIWAYLDAAPIGQVLQAPWDVVFTDVDVVEPDLVYISNQRASIITPAHARGAFGRPLELVREVGDVLTSPLFPGLSLPLERILRD